MSLSHMFSFRAAGASREPWNAMDSSTMQNTMWYTSLRVEASCTVAMMANTMDAAPRRPAEHSPCRAEEA